MSAVAWRRPSGARPVILGYGSRCLQKSGPRKRACVLHVRAVCLDQQPNVFQTRRAQCARAYLPLLLTMNRQSSRAGGFCYICLRFAIDRWTEDSFRHHHACVGGGDLFWALLLTLSNSLAYVRPHLQARAAQLPSPLQAVPTQSDGDSLSEATPQLSST